MPTYTYPASCGLMATLDVRHDNWPRNSHYGYLTALFNTAVRELSKFKDRYKVLDQPLVWELAEHVQAMSRRAMRIPAEQAAARIAAYALIRHWHNI